MSDLERLEARVLRLEEQLKELPRKILSDVKKLTDMHTHEMGGKIIWKVPVDELKKVLERQAATSNAPTSTLAGTERVSMNDALTIKKEPAEVK